MAILSTRNLSIGYAKKNSKYVVQSQLQLELKAGELVCLIGPNGCGKSTLLRTISGLQKAIEGEVLMNGKELHQLSVARRARRIALVLTDRVDLENATVYNIVAFGRHPYSNWWGRITPESEALIRQSIDMVHLNHKIDCNINELSDGERQRVMIAKALAQDTPIVLLDEPTAHLDLPNRVEIMLLLHRLAHDTNKCIMLSTHELDMALQAADKIWLMSETHGIECGVPEDLVFNGSFNRVFQSNSFVFNEANGNFSMNYPMTCKVWVEGDKTRMYWTLRALARAGYMVVPEANIKIHVNANSWQVSEQNFASIEALLLHLEKISTDFCKK